MSARLKEWLTERGAGSGPRALRMQKALVVGQIALAMALLVNASLLVESFRQLRSVDTGFRAEQVVTGKVLLPASRYPDAAARTAFVERLLSAARETPGLAAIGVADVVPLVDNRQGTAFWRTDRPPPEDPTRKLRELRDGQRRVFRGARHEAAGRPLVHTRRHDRNRARRRDQRAARTAGVWQRRSDRSHGACWPVDAGAVRSRRRGRRRPAHRARRRSHADVLYLLSAGAECPRGLADRQGRG